jgi:hypothetical protein
MMKSKYPPLKIHCGPCGGECVKRREHGLYLFDAPWTEDDEAMVDFLQETAEVHRRTRAEEERGIAAAVKRLQSRLSEPLPE